MCVTDLMHKSQSLFFGLRTWRSDGVMSVAPVPGTNLSEKCTGIGTLQGIMHATSCSPAVPAIKMELSAGCLLAGTHGSTAGLTYSMVHVCPACAGTIVSNQALATCNCTSSNVTIIGRIFLKVLSFTMIMQTHWKPRTCITWSRYLKTRSSTFRCTVPANLRDFRSMPTWCCHVDIPEPNLQLPCCPTFWAGGTPIVEWLTEARLIMACMITGQ